MDTAQSTSSLPLRRPAGGVTRLDVADGALRVTLAGVLTADCCAELRGTLMRGSPDRVRDVQLDAAGVSAVEDGVLGVLLACSAYVHSTGGQLSFVAASASVRRAVSALGLDRFYPLPVTTPAGPAAPSFDVAALLPQPRRPLESLLPTG